METGGTIFSKVLLLYAYGNPCSDRMSLLILQYNSVLVFVVTDTVEECDAIGAVSPWFRKEEGWSFPYIII